MSLLSAHPLEEILHPKSIAIVGASDTPATRGYSYTRQLLEYGYQGRIYPVNSRRHEVLGIKAYPRVRDIPGSVDYVICCIPARAVLNMLEDCAEKEVKCVNLYTARFSETGQRDAAELEQEILKRANKAGIRLIGPNCMGVYYPREGLSFSYDFPKEPGPVGMASQSGGVATLFIYSSAPRGVRFSKVISYGNALDFNESDYLDYFCQDPETKIILMYIEGVKDGRRFLNSLRHATSIKPVVIVKGGRGESGTRAAASHTAALAGSMTTWEAAIAQAGAVSAQNLDELADLAVSFCFLPPTRGSRVGITGGSGGPSVLAADECEEAGLDVIPLPPEMREEMKGGGTQILDWIGNPMDVSILGGFGLTYVDILHMMARNENFDLLIAIAALSEGAYDTKQRAILRLRTDVKEYIKVKRESPKPLLVVVVEGSAGSDNRNHWRWRLLSEARTKLIGAGIATYPSMGRAASAARKLIDYYRTRE